MQRGMETRDGVSDERICEYALAWEIDWACGAREYERARVRESEMEKRVGTGLGKTACVGAFGSGLVYDERLFERTREMVSGRGRE